MPKHIAENGSKSLENTVVGYFIGKKKNKLHYTLVKNATSEFWSKYGQLNPLPPVHGIGGSCLN